MISRPRIIKPLAVVLLSSLFLSNWTTKQAFSQESGPPEDETPLLIKNGEKVKRNDVRSMIMVKPVDQFGYTWDDTVPIDWKDATSGTEVFSPGSYVDDAVAGPILLPASVTPFRFYEYQYAEIYIGSNGLLGFNDSVMHDGACLENLPIPLDYEHPQAILAPFWDDLLLGGGYNSGAVYWDSGSDAYGAYFVVEWHEVSRVFSSDLLTFEVVLYQDGTVLFQYLALNGELTSATIGIEDSDGVDGLQYLYNGSGQAVNSGTAIRYTPPGSGFRTKAFPHYQGGMNTAGQSSYDIFVRNTGDQGSDIFNLAATSSDPGWEIAFYDKKGFKYLFDTTVGDGLPDTGQVGAGETFTVTVELKKPDGAGVGADTLVTINIASNNDPTQELDVQVETLIPAPFALIYREGQRIFTDLFSNVNTYEILQHQEFRGSSFAISALPEANLVSVWEHNELGTAYTNLYYSLVTSAGLLLLTQPQQLTYNNETDRDVRDFAPVVATSANGNIAVAWVRIRMGLDFDDPDTFLKVNQNIFLTIINSDGSQIILPETQITDQSGWFQPGDLDIQQFENLSLAASDDGRFHLAWVEKHILEAGTVTDISHAVFSAADGSPIMSPALFTSGDPDDEFDFFDPAMISYLDEQNQPHIMLFYFLQDNTGQGNPVSQLVYAVLNTDGSPDIAQTVLHTGHGYGTDADQLSDGRIAVAWTDTVSESERVAYMILGDDLSSPAPAAYMLNPDGRPSGIVSITHDGTGNAIFTWMDSKWFQRIYYASLDPGGELKGPMAFRYSSKGGVTNLQTSFGLGNARYVPWYRYFLPLVPRK